MSRRVMVEWIDSHSATGWYNVGDLDGEPVTCYSLGWLIHDSEGGVVVVGHLSGSEADPHQVAGAMTIPRSAIVRIEDFPSGAEGSGDD